MVNELEPGTRRVGDLIDFDPDTPEVKVVLEYSDRGIGITVPWSSDDDPYASWFLRDSATLRLPQRLDENAVPDRVLFNDSHGSVLLVGCHARGFHSNALGPGSGTLWARAAILGVRENISFGEPHGLQSDISGLRAWVGTSSWSENRDFEPRSMRVRIESLDVPDVNVGEYEGIDLAIRSGYGLRRESEGDRRVLEDYARCVTRSTQPKPWHGHLKLHRAVRDLLVLSRWHEESCQEVGALHLEDPLRTLDGATHGEQWRNVVVPDGAQQSAPRNYRPHLVQYSELGGSGLLRWIELRDEFARALDPIVSSISLKGTTPNTLLAHTGPGLEALGYSLLMRDGASKKQASNAPLKVRLERILSDLNSCLPFDGEAWVASTCATYNGLKHANRKEPDQVDVLNSWRECVLAARAWVAVELGVPHEKISERLSMDPQRHPYVEIS